MQKRSLYISHSLVRDQSYDIGRVMSQLGGASGGGGDGGGGERQICREFAGLKSGFMNGLTATSVGDVRSVMNRPVNLFSEYVLSSLSKIPSSNGSFLVSESVVLSPLMVSARAGSI